MGRIGWVAALGYVLTIFAANWLIQHVGPVGVGFGLMAPAGVYAAGLAFTLRDVVQVTLGRLATVLAILIGAALSYLVSPAFAVASATAFLFSELADFAVYTPLERRSWLGAVTLSNTVGLLVDSVLFLWLAFGSLAFLPGQLVGKAWMTGWRSCCSRGGDVRFWLGTHMPNWLDETATPLFVSHRRLAKRRRLPRARGPWALDSGGFTELNLPAGGGRRPASTWRRSSATGRRSGASVGGADGLDVRAGGDRADGPDGPGASGAHRRRTTWSCGPRPVRPGAAGPALGDYERASASTRARASICGPRR
jgi:hypothetical protein